MDYDKQAVVYHREGIRLDVGPKSGAFSGLHSHDDEYQIEVILDGESKSLLNKKTIKVIPGYIDVYNPTDLHHINYCNTDSFIFHLKVNAVKKIREEMNLRQYEPIFDTTKTRKFNIPLLFLRQEIALLKNMQEPSLTNGMLEKYKEIKTLSLLRVLLDEMESEEMSNHHRDADHCSQHKVKKAKMWIHENFTQEDISIATLAEISHLSPFHFIRVFKKVFGMSPGEYVNTIRAKEAVKILKRNKYRNREEVSLAVGFRNPVQLRYHLKKIK